jgi:chromosome segregation protein
MQDVIFNGSTSRKPASRASVELVFDNTLARAGGQWNCTRSRAPWAWRRWK